MVCIRFSVSYIGIYRIFSIILDLSFINLILVQQVSAPEPARNPQVEKVPGSRQSHVDHLPNTENRRFTYKELAMFTKNFERFIGQGGFGPVYYGRLEDNTEVAVKTRSESSSHGLDQFLAEVTSWSPRGKSSRQIFKSDLQLIYFCNSLFLVHRLRA
jgi:hypothetical protein